MARTPPRFEVRSGASDDPTVVMTGDLILSSAEPLLAAVDEALGTADGGPLRLDLSQVGFVDSSGLKALLDARARCADAGGSLVLDTPSEPVVRLLSMVDLLRTFEVIGVEERSG